MDENDKLSEEQLQQAAGGLDAGEHCYFMQKVPWTTREDKRLSTGLGLLCDANCFKYHSTGRGYQHQCRCHGHDRACVDKYHAIERNGNRVCS